MRIHYLFFYFLFASTTAQAQQAKQLIEICDNGIDDDGDGLIDCYDTNNCDCTPIPDCADTVRSSNFALQLAWEGNSNTFATYAGIPLVGNLDPTRDSISEIVTTKLLSAFIYPSSFTDRLLIFKGDCSNKNNPSELMIPSGIRLLYESPISIALADVNADNNPEIIVICADKRIRIFNNYDPDAIPVMQLWVTSLDTCALGQTTPFVADFDGDGKAEIYAGNEVFVFDFSNPLAPTLRKRLKGTGSAGRVANTNPTPLSEFNSFAADLLTVADCNGDPDCEGLEIAAGNMIYSVDIDPNDGDGYQIKIQRDLNLMTTGIPFSDGFTSVADVDLDNIPELLVTGTRGTQEGFYVWNKNGFLRFLGSNGFFLNTPNGSGYIGGQIAVANVYDDRKNGFTKDFPEIIVCDINFLNCYNLNAANANPTKPYWWKKQTDTALNTGGQIRSASIFDFDQNGRPEILLDSWLNGIEVIYGDALPLPMGVDTSRVWFSTANYGAGYYNGGYSYPVVADSDADGQAEIVVCGGTFNSGAAISVFEAEEVYHSTWASARTTWNQYSYAGININDDLSVPKVQQPGHLQIPAGSGQRPLNTFLTQMPLLGIAHEKYMPTPDATVTVLNVQCLGNLKFSVTVKVCNQGIIALPPNLPITFYKDGNPFVSAAVNMGTFTISPNSLSPGACVEFTTILQFTGSEVYAMVNDPGIGIFPLTDSDEFWKAECNYLNNAAKFKMNPAIGPSLSLGPDINGCTTPIYTFQATAGFASYLWQNGSTAASFTATSPGKYWVAAKDNCLNTRRDTVEIIVDTVLQNLNTAVCEGTNYLFNGTNILAGTTKNFVFTSSAGCDSTIRVQVGVLPKSQTSETRQICNGDSTLVFGNFIKTAGSFPKTFPNANGCDSLHTVQVALLPAPAPTSETRQICTGDSTLVFGNFIKNAGNFPKIFPNANGCDSLHTIQVSLLPTPLPTSETRQICTGDSTLVFGNFIKTAGDFPKIFSNTNGCDSLHTIQVALLPAPAPTSETRQICTGDSTLVFGNFIKTAGNFPKIFPNTNGCDSLHTIQVSLLPAPTPTSETRQICTGDSTLVFGNFIKTAGSFPKIFPNTNGCDSLHTIQVALLPAPAPTSETRQICTGDSTLVFGNFIKTAGSFPKIFPNTNGCDSLHTIQVTLLPTPAPTSETRQICTGDSTLVFGNFIKTAGNFPKIFPNTNGCDSLHTIQVALLPAPAPTSETRQICTGDSTLVFGNFIKNAGSFPKIFPNTNGCDSLHTIQVSLLPAPAPTSETRQICTGDSTLVFGNFIKTAGSFPKTFPNTNSCDSLHTIQVTLLPTPAPTSETRQICTGDSTLVFGNFIKNAGSFPKIFSNTNGCDSLHTIQVTLLPAPLPTSETRQICTGDSTLVFGNFIKTAGNFPKIFSNANGCDSLHTIDVIVTPILELLDSISFCKGDSIFIFGAWIKSTGITQQLVSGTPYCDTLWTVYVSRIDPPTIDFQVEQPTALDANGKVIVTAQQDALYGLNGQISNQKLLYDSLVPGGYTLFQQFKGCLSTVDFQLIPFQKETPTDIYAPNVFTPNNENDNAVFTLYAPPGLVDQISWFRVYDRWGSMVFEQKNLSPNDETQGWTGLAKSKPAPIGVYIWQAQIKYSDGRELIKSGDTMLVR